MISKELRKWGLAISISKSRTLMKELGLVPIQLRKKSIKKQENKNKSLRDLLLRIFKPDAPNAAWVGDVIEFKLSGNPFYLCVIMDLWIGYNKLDRIRIDMLKSN